MRTVLKSTCLTFTNRKDVLYPIRYMLTVSLSMQSQANMNSALHQKVACGSFTFKSFMAFTDKHTHAAAQPSERSSSTAVGAHRSLPLFLWQTLIIFGKRAFGFWAEKRWLLLPASSLYWKLYCQLIMPWLQFNTETLRWCFRWLS